MKTIAAIYPARDSVRNFEIMMLMLLLMIMFAPISLFAQQGRGAMADSAHHEPYNVNTIETVIGKVSRIDQLPGRREGMVGIHAMLETGDETIEVHLGPYSYISKQTLQLKEGDTIEVTGSRITHENKPAILATKVKNGEEVLTLRDEKGKPLWRGKGKR